MKWTHFPHYWHFWLRIQWLSVDSEQIGQRATNVLFVWMTLLLACINVWTKCRIFGRWTETHLNHCLLETLALIYMCQFQKHYEQWYREYSSKLYPGMNAGRTPLMVRQYWVRSIHSHQNDHGGVSNHQPHVCLLNRLFSRRSKKHQSSASLAFVREIHRDRWIPRTKDQ